MIPHECREVREKLDELGAAGPIGEEYERLRGHLQGCASCREFAEILDQIGEGLEKVEPDPFLERRVYNAVLSESRPDPRPAPGRWLWIALPVAAAACIAAVLLWPAAPQSGGRTDRSPSTAQSPPVSPRSQDARPAPEIEADIKETADGRRYIEVFDGTALWLDSRADVAVEALSAGLARFRLKSGRAVAEIGPHTPGFRFVVRTPSGEVEAKGTVFAVEVGTDGSDRVRVLKGTVEVRTLKEKKGQLLHAGQAMVIGDTAYEVATEEDIARDRSLFELCTAVRPQRATAERVQSAADLAELARKYRREKRYTKAAKTYQRLIADYPESDAALRGTVALAQIELDIFGRPDDALGHFNAYLDKVPTGPLAEASHIGRVRALARSNRQKDVLEAVQRYLRRYPSSNVTPEMLRTQGDALSRLGRCKEASTLYRRIIASWPESRESERARAGLANCGAALSHN